MKYLVENYEKYDTEDDIRGTDETKYCAEFCRHVWLFVFYLFFGNPANQTLHTEAQTKWSYTWLADFEFPYELFVHKNLDHHLAEVLFWHVTFVVVTVTMFDQMFCKLTKENIN